MSSERPRRGVLLVVSSPSGAGKTSLTRRLLADHAELELSISMTTRTARPGEMDGREYHFVDRATFVRMAEAGEFLEWAEVHEHQYGTPRAPVEAAIATGHDVIFDIDWQGARAVAAAMGADVVRVFVLPPTMADLSRRLHARAQDAEDVIARRLGRAKGEIAMWAEYDYVILNDDFDRAYAELAHVYHAERLRRARNPWLEPFVAALLAEELPG
ncbi:MAG TPA: guanylate kinase [Caulobacteraceae bacterium]|jgi:guanylate kinase|nr:guanylate kinase [Caulobacteraceae bacterium]